MASTIWKGHLTFGLISIPIKLVRAARAEKVRMHHLQRGTGARVRQVLVPATDDPVSEQEGLSLVAAKGTLAKDYTPTTEEAPSYKGITRSELGRGLKHQKDRTVE